MIDITSTGAWNYNESTYNENHYLDAGVAKYIANLLGNNCTLLDFGCGAGYYLKYINDLNSTIDILGVEPLAESHADLKTTNIVSRDLTEEFDLGKRGNLMCIEVLEHIPAELESKAVDNIIKHCSNYLIISWAKVGQGGHGHINCKDQCDVIPLFESKGYTFLEKESLEARSLASLWWIQNNLCIFKKN